MKTLNLIITAIFASVLACYANFTEDEVATTFSARDVEVAPVPVKQEQPNVPSSLRGQAGRVYVGFIVGADGKVIAPRIMRTENEALNDVAMDCVAKWTFKPAQKDGSPVPMRVVVPLRFS
jgi:TonB family protein